MRPDGSSCLRSIRVISGVSRSQAPRGDQTRERRVEWRLQAAGISSTTERPSRQARQKTSRSAPRLVTTPAPVMATGRFSNRLAPGKLAADLAGEKEVHHRADGGQAGDVLVLQGAGGGLLPPPDGGGSARR